MVGVLRGSVEAGGAGLRKVLMPRDENAAPWVALLLVLAVLLLLS